MLVAMYDRVDIYKEWHTKKEN